MFNNSLTLIKKRKQRSQVWSSDVKYDNLLLTIFIVYKTKDGLRTTPLKLALLLWHCFILGTNYKNMLAVDIERPIIIVSYWKNGRMMHYLIFLSWSVEAVVVCELDTGGMDISFL